MPLAVGSKQESVSQTGAGPAPGQVVIGATLGFIVSSCMQTATKLEIPDLIAAGTKKVSELAAKTNVQEDALYRILRVLEMAGMVAEKSGRSFELTAAGALLCTGGPGSMRDLVQYMTDPLHYKLYGALTPSLQARKTPFDNVFGEPVFQWFARPENREEDRKHTSELQSRSDLVCRLLLEQ